MLDITAKEMREIADGINNDEAVADANRHAEVLSRRIRNAANVGQKELAHTFVIENKAISDKGWDVLKGWMKAQGFTWVVDHDMQYGYFIYWGGLA